MGNIRILSENVVSKIAAGEIVERPSSVVKELIENSIDAGSTSIRVELRQGGKKLIKVSDNGEGMNKDDALLSLERHATSKLKNINDLFTIKTLGFRGEALPSIASVSRFSITTRTKDELVGTTINVMGGTIKSVEETGCPHGTIVELRDLFYNTPPRLKFLKTTETELRNIIDVIQREALSRTDVRFEVLNDGRDLINLPQRNSIDERLSEIFPDTNLYKIYAEDEDISVHGYMNGPDESRSTTQRLYTYVNFRAIRDRLLTRIAIESYGRILEKGRYPQGVLSIQIPIREVDVNVHPTKNEVRFRSPRKVGDLIKYAISEMLTSAPWIKDYHKRVEKAVYEFHEFRKGYELRDLKKNKRSESHKEGGYIKDHKYEVSLSSESPSYIETEVNRDKEQDREDIFGNKGYFSSLKIVGQVGDLYIVCESSNGIVLIDQHAAHERINYEKLKESYLNKNKIEIQELLIPTTIELSPYESELLKMNLEDIENIGIKIEEFGEGAFLVRSIPAIFKNTDIKRLIKDMIGEIAATDKEKSLSERIDNIISTIACHSSIRANDVLNHEQIKALLEDLDYAKFPHSCPHGRPIARELSFTELEKMFKRS
ncbi:MAG: DNA mismatch repair endonuclease MutL [Thermodesulfobacteriota bacterium]